MYINGSLHQDFATSIVPNFSSIARITIGKSTSLSAYQSDCAMNDFRIYDHALSAKEIKEISKGLVLHYNFEDPWIEPTTNVLAGKSLGFGNRWSTVTTYPDGYTPKDRVLKRVTNDPYFGYANTFLSNTNNPSSWAGKYLTLSCWYYRPTSSDPKISFRVYAYNGTSYYSTCTNQISATNLNVYGSWAEAIIVLVVIVFPPC